MKTYLVGGAVRDQLLGLEVTDRDWVVVGATTADMIDAGYTQVGKDFPVFLHPDSKEEYALARRERKTGSGYTGFECDTESDVSLEDDLLRRDLTINAMAQADDGSIIDPYNGQQDLADGVMRHISPAFVEDPLRVLRVARFAARFADRGFEVHPDTNALMRKIAASGELESLPAERIWQELSRALMEPQPQRFWQVLDACGALQVIFPEIVPVLGAAAIAEALPRAAAAKAALAVRMALCSFELTPDAHLSLYERLQPPKDCRILADALNRNGILPDHDEVDGNILFNMIEALDYLRRPGLLAQFIEAHTYLGAPADMTELLAEGAVTMRAINASSLQAKGIEGKALGDALRQARRDALETLL